MDSVGERTTSDLATKEPGSVEAVTAARASRPPASGEALPIDPAVLDRLLVMANAYRSEGHDRQAMELYWELAEDYPGTLQSDAARAVLLELASSYAGNGVRHLARSIYERLL